MNGSKPKRAPRKLGASAHDGNMSADDGKPTNDRKGLTMSKKQNTETTANDASERRAFFALADAESIKEFASRNALQITVTSAAVWFKDAELARAFGATRCARINTKKNRTRGNWYITRVH